MLLTGCAIEGAAKENYMAADLDDIESKLSQLDLTLIGIDTGISQSNELLTEIVKLMKELIQEAKKK